MGSYLLIGELLGRIAWNVALGSTVWESVKTLTFDQCTNSSELCGLEPDKVFLNTALDKGGSTAVLGLAVGQKYPG